MAENSKIEWTTHTFNPVRGCVKVSPGCANCYAEVSAPSRVARGNGLETWGKNAARIVASEAMWAEPIKWNRNADEELDAWLHDYDDDKGAIPERPRVFCASLADVFEDYQGGNVCDSQGNKLYDDLTPVRARLFKLMMDTPCVDWLDLTKRPENVMRMIAEAMAWMIERPAYSLTYIWLKQWLDGNPPHNVWIGTTCENQEMADKRIPELLKIPARVRFLSVEPMLGPVVLPENSIPSAPLDPADLEKCKRLNARLKQTEFNQSLPSHLRLRPMISWVICGCESGHARRPMKHQWAQSLADQCKESGVAFFMKQMLNMHGDVSGVLSDLPGGLQVREFPTVEVHDNV